MRVHGTRTIPSAGARGTPKGRKWESKVVSAVAQAGMGKVARKAAS
jgi:hypothetical protein